jgi:hypothetical protein
MIGSGNWHQTAHIWRTQAIRSVKKETGVRLFFPVPEGVNCHTDFPVGLLRPSNWQVFLATSLTRKSPDVGF